MRYTGSADDAALNAAVPRFKPDPQAQARFVADVDHAGRFVVPEFLQENATARNLAQAALNLFDDTVTRRRLEALFAGFASELKADTGALAAAAVAEELARAGVAC